MIINKFKNGNISMKLEKSDIFYYGTNGNLDIDKLYNNEITMNDLYFNQINGYMYLVDYNTGLVYDYSNGYSNVLIQLKSDLLNGSIKLYSLSKKYSKSLLQDLENGY